MTQALSHPDLLLSPLPQSGKKIVIAIDGPAAAGKGTLARKMAERLGYAYLETGALYRAVALATLEMKGDPGDIADALPALEIIKQNLTPELLANPELRSERVAAGASKVSALPAIRAALLKYQREFAENPPGTVGGAILDGRDIGTVVCPDADVKLFVTASVEERARRRQKENPGTAYEDILKDMQERDLRDKSRATAPTKVAEDAYVLDTTGVTPEEVMEEAIAALRARFLRETFDSTQV